MLGSGPIVALRDRMVVNPSARPGLRLFLFHHAGASAAAMLPLARQMPPEVEVVAFELPGRGVRSSEPAAESFVAARDDLLGRARQLLDTPVVLFGHSLGGVLADSIARALAADAGCVRRVILSACPYPSRVRGAASAGRRSAQSLRAQLQEYGGTPEIVFDTPELLEYVLRVFGSDMLLVDSACGPPGIAPAGLRHEFWFGAADRSVPPSAADAWSATLARKPKVRIFEGGHFYLFAPASHAGQVLRTVLGAEIAAMGAAGKSDR
jgi:surfactin synthase thioesterase subunit